MAASLPTGTVTFLYTDIVGSTNLARKYPDRWPGVQARHHDLLRAAITTHQGYIFRTVGDEFNAAFETALEALAAALDAQFALNAEDWGEMEPVQVRMGLHTGRAVVRAGEYEGYLTLSYTKRLMSAAYGGQILISEATAALLRDQLPEGISLRDLGGHRLKDFDRLEHIFQVVAAGLPSEFPPIKSLDGSPNNLPAPLTSFIGREREVGEVRQGLARDRILTLTGPSGSGKTRLALQAAAEVIDTFPDGVFFIALATITDPGLVPSTIAQCLGVAETPGRTILDNLKDHLRDKSLLLLLDNFEQVITAAPIIADLLVACLHLKVLVTSREALHISGEREIPVPPLDVPDLNQMPSLEAISQYAAVELFVQRANAVKPDFRMTDETAPAVAEICFRLDGLPLAIELAAARIKLLPPQAILARLGSRLDFLTGGARDLPERQKTLRNAIAWSYDLLDENEKTLFRQLSVFAGGCTVEAVEAVAGDNPSGDVLDRLGSLLDKSLLQEVESGNGEPRFVMLETLREFGREQLRASGEQEAVQRRHASYFLALAEQAAARLESTGQVEWMNRMEQEHNNLRAALEWSKTAAGAGDICLRLAGALGLFWEVRGHFSEGRERLASLLLTEPAQGSTPGRARLLARAAELAYRQSDFAATTAYAAGSLDIFRELGDRQGSASALIKLGNAAAEFGDYAAASRHLEEALNIWRELGDQHGIARALISYGWAALRSGDYPLAEERLAEALGISRRLGDTRSTGFELAGLGEVALRQGETTRATRLVEESLELRRKLGNKWGVGVSLGILGWIAIHEGNWDHAIARLSESLEIRQEIGDRSGSAWCLERLADVEMRRGRAEKAVRLLGAAAALRASVRAVVDPVDLPEYEGRIMALREELGEERFAIAWEEGEALTLEQAAAYAREA